MLFNSIFWNNTLNSLFFSVKSTSYLNLYKLSAPPGVAIQFKITLLFSYTSLLLFICFKTFFLFFFPPCNYLISSAMRASYAIKNNQIRVRSSDTNLRRLFNTTAAVKDVRGKSLRGGGCGYNFISVPLFCTTVLLLRQAWLSAPRQLKTSLISHTSPTTL